MLYATARGLTRRSSKSAGRKTRSEAACSRSFENMENSGALNERGSSRSGKIQQLWQFLKRQRRANRTAPFLRGRKSDIASFGRAGAGGGELFLCLSDYVLPARDGKRASFWRYSWLTCGGRNSATIGKATTEGTTSSRTGCRRCNRGTAESVSEGLHGASGRGLGIPDSPEMTMAQRFTSRFTAGSAKFWLSGMPNLEESGTYSGKTMRPARDWRGRLRRLHDGRGSECEPRWVHHPDGHVFWWVISKP